jgi:hypothetical protein
MCDQISAYRRPNWNTELTLKTILWDYYENKWDIDAKYKEKWDIGCY